MMYYLYDATYILVVIGAIISIIASMNVKSTFARYSRGGNNRTDITGAEAAQEILRAAGITDVRIERVRGNLTDHYSPKEGVLRLSDSVYDSRTIAAVGVAAHECGHAIQHAKNYAPLSLRSALVPVANFGSMLAWPLILIGLFINGRSSTLIIDLGIVLFSAAVLFQLVTLPVEFDASRRALVMLRTQNILSDDELKNTRKVLKSAAFTYVASAAAAILQLLRIILLVGGRRDDR